MLTAVCNIRTHVKNNMMLDFIGLNSMIIREISTVYRSKRTSMPRYTHIPIWLLTHSRSEWVIPTLLSSYLHRCSNRPATSNFSITRLVLLLTQKYTGTLHLHGRISYYTDFSSRSVLSGTLKITHETERSYVLWQSLLNDLITANTAVITDLLIDGPKLCNTGTIFFLRLSLVHRSSVEFGRQIGKYRDNAQRYSICRKDRA